MDRCLTLCLLFVIISCAFAQQYAADLKIPEVDQQCMECICQASSNCDETIKCHNGGGSSYFCGPYVISWAYWHDGGRPGDKGRAHDFETCLNNKTCAEEAVRGYMRKYGQDCDGNRVIDCNDFARIHKLGFGACGGKAIQSTDYYEKFDICYNGAGGYAVGGNDAGGYAAGGNDAGGYDDGGYPAFPGANGDYEYGEGSIQARNAHTG